MNFTFEGEVAIHNWQTNERIRTMPAFDAFGYMARSTRWDTEHMAASVRLLAPADAREQGIDPTTPVYFRNVGVYPLLKGV